MSTEKIQSTMNFNQNQVFGNQQPFQHIQQQDIINSIQFDPTGELLAIGDNAGRIILFKQQDDQFGFKKTFQYYSEFQSHIPEFDSLKSLTLSQSIKQIKWLKPQGKYKKMITSSCHSIKLWKLYEKKQNKVILTGKRQGHFHQDHNFMMPQLNTETVFTVNPQLTFPLKHNQAINSIDTSHNEEFILSTDTDQGLIWNFQKYEHPFVVQDVNSKKNWKQGEKITCSKFHPKTDNIFLIGSTKGTVQMSDLRQSFNNRTNLSFLSSNIRDRASNYFNQMTIKVNSLQFLSDGKYIVSRDYQSIKIWDVCRPSEPVNSISINDSLKDKMCSLFENDCIEDEFSISHLTQNLIITGTYDNRFNIIDPLSSQNVEYVMKYDNHIKKSLLNKQKSTFSPNFDFNRKIISCGVHRPSRKIALASLNSFFIYTPQTSQFPETLI